ncbi:MAG: hypothetical protein QOE97_2339 [Pseudonocardiales bacterium]|jgi:hypothetical protein|nr:hypothetical protein [Pseudonocardiales bacterium]
MFKLLLALHVLVAVFAIGPLAHAVTTAGRGIRHGDASATAAAARTARVYAYASVVVVLIGFGLMSVKRNGRAVGEFGDVWIWLSALLWLLAVIIALGAIVPALDDVTERIGKQESVVAMTARVSALGGAVAVIFGVIVFLMVYRPGA